MLTTLQKLRSSLYRIPVRARGLSVKADDVVNSVETEVFEDDTEEDREQIIERKRNKSRLLPQHRNMLNEVMPYSEPKEWFHQTVKYKRRSYGRYGSASDVNPGLMWPTKEELQEIVEYEQIAHPETLQEMMETVRKKREEEAIITLKREKTVLENMAKLEGWKQDLIRTREQKLAAARAAQERKERLVEEVRRHFGYKVDPRDDRFKEMVAQKEKEQRKAVKEAKKKEREAKLQARLAQKAENTTKDESTESQ